jgi:hypothetical protein
LTRVELGIDEPDVLGAVEVDAVATAGDMCRS